ncbi:SPOR domain-containing protein [Simplicispira piscis]
MLRFFVLVLLLANAAYYAWSQGLLLEWGLAPVSQSEPQRLAEQIRPEALRVVGSKTSAPAVAPAAAAQEPTSAPAPAPVEAPVAAAPAGECLQAGVFDEEQAAALRRAAASLPQGSWTLERTTIAGRWMVYMGRFADADALAKKRAELREMNIPYDRPGSAALEPGLSLGRFSTEEAAQRGLSNLTAKGVRTARVVQERNDAPGYTLRLPAADSALRARVEALRTPMAGKALRPCS